TIISFVPVSIRRDSPARSRSTRRPEYVHPASDGVTWTGSAPFAAVPAGRCNRRSAPRKHRLHLVSERHGIGAAHPADHDRRRRVAVAETVGPGGRPAAL